MVPEKAPSLKKKTTKTATAKAAQPKTKKEKIEVESSQEEISTEAESNETSERNFNEKIEETAIAAAPVTSAPPQATVAQPIAPVVPIPARTEGASPGNQAVRTPEPRPAQPNRPVAPFKLGDDYTLLVHYDKATRVFTGEVAEIAEVSATGLSREEVLKQLSMKLEDHIEDRRAIGALPEAVFSRKYPERLNVVVSQSVYRKLDMLSRQEKVSLDQLVVELLSSAVDRRLDGGKGGQKLAQPASNQNNIQRQDQNRHNNRGGHGGGHNRGGGGRHAPTGNLDNRENFMEYVRNLEKGGGRWKK